MLLFIWFNFNYCDTKVSVNLNQLKILTMHTAQASGFFHILILVDT